MTKHRLLLTLSIPLVISSCLTGCEKKEKRIEDNRELTAFERTQLSDSAIDALGREIPVVDLCKDGNTVGIFYHVWHGYHNDNRGIYDVTKLLHDNPEALFNLDVNEPASPLGQYHYWGEPLYGYYSSDDPWVVARHMELLTTAGVDYICMDLSNAFVYTKTINVIFQTLDKFQKQ